MTTYHKINSANKDELKQIAIQTAELNQKMYAKLEEVYKQCMATYGSDYMDVADLLAEARGDS